VAGDFVLALAFDGDSPDFAHGVEIGRLWEQLRFEPDEAVEQLVHAVNAEMCMRIGEALGRPFEADVLDDVWMEVRYGPAELTTTQEDPT
jgi:hypothetical protein